MTKLKLQRKMRHQTKSNLLRRIRLLLKRNIILLKKPRFLITKMGLFLRRRIRVMLMETRLLLMRKLHLILMMTRLHRYPLTMVLPKNRKRKRLRTQ